MQPKENGDKNDRGQPQWGGDNDGGNHTDDNIADGDADGDEHE